MLVIQCILIFVWQNMIVISGRSLLFPAQPLRCEEWQGAIFFTAQVQGSGSDQKAVMSSWLLEEMSSFWSKKWHFLEIRDIWFSKWNNSFKASFNLSHFYFFLTLGSKRIFRRKSEWPFLLFSNWRTDSLGNMIMNSLVFPSLSEVGLTNFRKGNMSDAMNGQTAMLMNG